MRVYRFDVKEHEDYGTMGLAPRWYPNGDPLEGMAAAHDILEHFPNDSGDTEGELMALGAAIFVRADGGYSNKYRHFDEVRDIASDFINICQLHFERENSRALRVAPRCQDEWVRNRASDARNAARNLVKAEDSPSSFGDADWHEVARWIAHGYQKARKRYKGASACRVAGLFMDIERACNDALEHCEGFGEVVEVRVDFTRFSASVRVVYPSENY